MIKKIRKNSEAIDISREREKNQKRLLNNDTFFDVRESYNELRTNVMFSLTNVGCKKILVTSSVASEGKSTTCFNLAITFAEAGAKVLVVDCDLRRPNIDKLVGVHNELGLSTLMIGACKVEQALNKTNYKNLDVILSGKIPPNPTELLSSENMKVLIENLSEKYDYIFLDTPPISIVTDAALLSGLVDGAVIVSRQYVTERKILLESVNKLKFVNMKVIGVVLNDVVSSKVGYGDYGYRKEYKYGY